MTALDISRCVSATVRQIAKHGGATESLVAGVETPTSGYAVSIPGREAINHLLLDGEHRTDAITESVYNYALDNKHWLAQPGFYLGAWLDGDRLVLDVTQVTPELGQAVTAGVQRDQDAIYNLATGGELWLKRKHLTTLSDEQIKVWELLDVIELKAEKGIGEPFEVVAAFEVAADSILAQVEDGTWNRDGKDELTMLVKAARDGATGDSNDDEIEALQAALDEALRQLCREDLRS